MSSAEYSCKLFKRIFAYRQTVWTLEEQSDLGPHCLQKRLLKSQADDKADDSCCDWQFKGCVEILRPSQPNGVMSSAVSLPNHTFTGQA